MVSVRSHPFCVGLLVGLLTTFVLPAPADARTVNAISVTSHDDSWGILSADQQNMVDMVAADIFHASTTMAQRQQLTGLRNGRYDNLTGAMKMPYRRAALKRLGVNLEELARRSV